jgi:RimJ/RimL family protein N-acetyltransferase
MTSDGAAPFVPDDFVVPLSLVTEAFRLEPLGPEHNEADYAAWHSSIDHIKSTPGVVGRSWPRPEMTLDDNLKDLQGHARDFANRTGFTYTVRDTGSGEIIGCVYIYPWKKEPGTRILSWVRASRASLDAPVYEAVSEWLRTAWPFTSFAYAPR